MIRNTNKWHVGAVICALAWLLAGGRVAAQQSECFGDCNNDGRLTASDIGRINATILRCSPCEGGIPGGIAIGCPMAPNPGPGCLAADFNDDGCLRASELGRANQNILRFPPDGCPPEATPTPGMPFCGNGIVEADEECDIGGACRGGDNDGTLCTNDTPCTGGGTCQTFGGTGCAANCTEESVAVFSFTGAKCYGGAKDSEPCTLKSSCVGGTKPGRPCVINSDCPSGACVSECGADSRGCFGDGECTIVVGGGVLGSACPAGAPSNCVGGTTPGIPCSTNTDCSGGGTCQTRICAGGANASIPCTADAQCPQSTCVQMCGGTGSLCLPRSRATLNAIGIGLNIGPLIGQQTTHYGKPGPDGIIPIANPAAGTSFEPVIVPGLVCACVRGGDDPGSHGPGNSGSGIINCGAGTIQNDISIGRDHSTLPPRVCAGGPNDGMPCTPICSAASTTPGIPCAIVGTNSPDCGGATNNQRNCQANAACGIGLTAGTCTGTNGPGACSANSGNAGRACRLNVQCTNGGTCEGRCTVGPNTGATCGCTGALETVCVNTTQCGAGGRCNVTGIRGGGFCMGPAKFCVGGTSPGKSCFNASECGAGGTCPGEGNFLAYCDSDSDCPGSRCNSIDDATCSLTDDVSGSAACRETREFCTTGLDIGEPCETASTCRGAPTGSNGCGNDCNVSGLHPNVCNSPSLLVLSGAGGQGSALLLSTTAIGTIADGGTCALAAQCAGGSQNGAPCFIAADCPGGACAPALCNGLCANDSTIPCLTNNDCSLVGGLCTAGAMFNTPCTGQNPTTECGANAVCIPVNPGKGFDGLPCTDDDADAAKGIPQTIPQTTGRSSTFIADADNVAGQQLVHGAAFDNSEINRAASVVGTPFDCSTLTSGNPSPVGVRLANTFPTLDGQTQDAVVATFLTAR